MENSLAIMRPDIAAEWDYEANIDLTPSDVMVGSGKKVGWKCSIDERHRWRTTINNRTKPNGTGCPYCVGRKLVKGENDLATLRPEIAAEWDYEVNGSLTPSDVVVGSQKKVGWKCSRDERHRWLARVEDRTKPDGTECPYCAGKKPIKGENDLATLRPEIAAEWDYEANGKLTPQDVTVSSGKKVGWKCSIDERHRWFATIYHRTGPNGTGCPYCAGKKPVKGENDLATLRPEIAAEWDYEVNGNLTPSDVVVGSQKKVGWKCSRDERHRWFTAINSRTEPNGSGCPDCAGRKPVKGENDLATIRPDIAAEWDYEANGKLTPHDVTVRSGKKVWWKCSRDEEHCWEAIIASRTSDRGTGCPYCSGRHPIREKNDLATLCPEIAAEWDYEANGKLTPQDVTVRSGKKVGWKCSCDERHRWFTAINIRTEPNGSGCPYCSGYYPVEGETDLGTVRPDIAAEWDYEANGKLTPHDVTVGSSKKVWWKCSRDEEHCWEAIIASRTSDRGSGCPYCAGKKPVKGENDLATLRPEIAAEWDYEANGKLTPQDVTVRSGKKVGWKCSCDERHRWSASINNRTKPNGTGCPHCKKPGKTGRAYV